jgi:hypothetical protein
MTFNLMRSYYSTISVLVALGGLSTVFVKGAEELSPLDTLQKANAMEFRFYSISQTGEVDQTLGRRIHLVNTPPSLEAIVGLFKDRAQSLKPLSSGGAGMYLCVLVLYDDYVGTRISLPAFIVTPERGSSLYKDILAVCEEEDQRLRRIGGRAR